MIGIDPRIKKLTKAEIYEILSSLPHESIRYSINSHVNTLIYKKQLREIDKADAKQKSLHHKLRTMMDRLKEKYCVDSFDDALKKMNSGEALAYYDLFFEYADSSSEFDKLLDRIEKENGGVSVYGKNKARRSNKKDVYTKCICS